MDIRGWVYVMTNPSMPGLVKVGFSTKDPKVRALDFNGSGLPDAYEVPFDLLVEQPRTVEQVAHRLLSTSHHNKEWFRCSVETALSAVRRAAGEQAMVESPGQPVAASSSQQSVTSKQHWATLVLSDAQTPSPALAEIVGDEPIPRTEATKRMWDYIKKHDLQDKATKTMINADAKLERVFAGKRQVSIFEMMKLIGSHLR